MPTTLTATAANPTFRPDQHSLNLFSNVNATVDAGDKVDQITITVTNVTDPLNEKLVIDGTSVELNNGNNETTGGGYMVTVALAGGTATVTIVPPGPGISETAFEALIENLAYQHFNFTSQVTGARAITITGISDSSGDDAVVSVSSTATPVKVNDLVSVSTGGTQGNSNSFTTQVNAISSDGSISLDGSIVVFQATATNLATDPNGAIQDIFLRNRSTGQTILVSQSIDGDGANASSSFATVSADGRYVAFLSQASDLVSGDIVDNGVDVFVRDTQNDTTVSVTLGYNGGFGEAEISQDGLKVVFTGNNVATNLVTAASVGGADGNGASDIFVRNADGTGDAIRASLADDETEANAGSSEGTISANGQYVVFSSLASNLIGSGVDTNGGQDIFRRDIINNITIRVSVSDSEAQSTNGSTSSSASVSD
ncbi:MAG TPA: hypothetical protein VGX37_09010, partial [Allosphingosinicella sp.]|nr:hypothetical protein [Allosphingosinicella sp.]